ncbi:MAG: DNA polymerase III subunit alpha, partial [Duncaniella sp.]|nr:DNA polymerase III subunit alpha [Duncaniella sp.]
IYDFVERVPAGTINRRVLENLIYAGAFDSFEGVKREDFFYENPRGEVFTEVLVRYGQAFQNDKHNSAMSLFGDDAELSTAGRPPVVPQKEWANAVKLERERELVGIYLSAHPLDPYYMELNYGVNSIKAYTEAEPIEGSELIFGGMVIDFTSRPSRNGGMFGILKIEDYTGSTELILGGQTYIDFHKYGVPGTPILIEGGFGRRFSTSPVRFNIRNIRLLNEVKGTLVRSITIDLPSEKVTQHVKELIAAEIKRSGDAKGELSFRIFDPSINRSLHLRSNRRIDISRKLVETLTEEDINFSIND